MLRIIALVLLAALLSAPSAEARDWTIVRIGSEGAYPPFNTLDGDNRLQGFEIDIAEALCSRMRVQCQFVQQDWDDMIPALLAGKFDIVMASMSITEERKRHVAFSRRYYRSVGSFVARRTTHLRRTEPAAMTGRVVGVQAKTTYARYLEALYAPAGVVVKPYATQQEAQLDLVAGRIDALLASKIVMADWLAGTTEGKCCAFAGEDVHDPKYLGDGVGAAFRPADNDLRKRFDDALGQILSDGTYNAINDRYFSFSVY
jgi:lysine-arginine-ornithine-binding protein